MSEKTMRKSLVKKLRILDAHAIENPMRAGVPDINYADGWIECKWLRAWPKRRGTVVKLDHPLLKSQKVWIRRRIRHGGKVWVMLQCGREWFLFKGSTALDSLGNSTRLELHSHAFYVWKIGLDADKLITILETNRPDRVWTEGEKREAAWDAMGRSI